MTKLLVLMATALAAASPHSASLQRDVANAFAAALDRLAVMQQPPEDGADLGQSLPHGIVDRVDCDRTRCTVHWLTVDRKPRTTSYVVKRGSNGCLTGAADPPLPSVRDVTIGSYSDNPLNAIGSSC